MGKKFFLIIFVLFFVNCGFSVGILNGNNLVYYTNNSNPNFKLEISAPLEPLIVSNATININGENFNYNLGNVELTPGESKNFSFNLLNFNNSNGNINNLITGDNVKFDLFILNFNGKKVSYSLGLPTSFYIVFDNESAKINHFSNLNLKYDDVNNFSIDFSENIYSYKIYDSSNNIIKYNDLLKSNHLEFKFNDEDLVDGKNELKIIFSDYAGNINETTFKIFYVKEDLILNLVTNEQEGSLSYYYNSTFKNFLNGKIYSNKKDFDLKVKTNKQARCIYSKTLSGFIDSPITVFNLTSSDNKNHFMPIDLKNDHSFGYWISCYSLTQSSEKKYLSRELGLGDTLLKIEYYNKELNILSVSPSSKATYSPFDIKLVSNQKSRCYFKKSALSNLNLMNSTNGLNHNLNLSLVDSNYNFYFECFDVLNQRDTKTISNFEVKSADYVSILDYSPKYTDSSSLQVQVNFTEPNANCTFSKSEIFADNFNSATPFTGTGRTRTMSINSLTSGENIIYVACMKNSQYKFTNLNIIYDPYSGPKLSNLVFFKDSFENSIYVGSNSKIGFKFNVTSVPNVNINKYFVEFLGNNKTLNHEFSSNRVTINDNITDISSMKVFGRNEFGINGTSLTKQIKFDFEKPVIRFEDSDGKLKIICVDSKSGCSKIMYCTSNTPLCVPNLVYNSSSFITYGVDIYVGAKAYDNVGNSQENSKILGQTQEMANDTNLESGDENSDYADEDGDGIYDINDPDVDGDGNLDQFENILKDKEDGDIDGDNINNINDGDIDGDGILNGHDPDVDGDGILDHFESDLNGIELNDLDGDGKNNINDGDIDGDGILNGYDNDILKTDSENQGDNNPIDYVNNNEDNQSLDGFKPISEDTLPTGNQKSKVNYILIVSLVLVLAGVSGGGYYSYKKGYLDSEIKKLKIKFPKLKLKESNEVFTSNSSSKNIRTSKSENLDLSKLSLGSKPKTISKKLESSKINFSGKKTNYDKH